MQIKAKSLQAAHKGTLQPKGHKKQNFLEGPVMPFAVCADFQSFCCLQNSTSWVFVV